MEHSSDVTVPGILSVAHRLGQYAAWQLSNLKIQKILYIAQVFHMGRNGGVKLMSAKWQAWQYGPVCPALYHELCQFGPHNVTADVFLTRDYIDESRNQFIQDIATALALKDAGYLIDLTHHPKGAWAKHYAGDYKMDIPDQSLMDEYRNVYSSPDRPSQKSAL